MTGVQTCALPISIQRQESVIHNILDLSRLEAGGRKYRVEPIRLDSLLGSVIDDYRSTIEAHKIELKKSIPRITVNSDSEMLFHVFSNLINNAIKFRNKQGTARIELTLEQSEKEVTVMVADNGIGMTELEENQAFERFYQASASAEGSGVGLNISRMIIIDLNGKIWIESAGLNKGTAVFVRLQL